MFVQISKTMRSFNTLISGILLFLFPVILSAQPTENALLWKISGKGLQNPSYILGTYHLVNNQFLDNIKGCKEALKKAQSVMGELEVTPAVAAEMMPYMLMRSGSLDSLLTADQYDSLSASMQQKLGMPMVLFNKMKPIGIYMMLATGEMQKTSMVSDYSGVPMDLYVQQEALKNKKEVLALESVKDQAELLFNNTPLDRQVEMLMDYVRKGDQSSSTENDRMNACYKAQDLNCLDSLMQSSGYSSIESDLLLKDRNIKWIPRIEETISRQSCFIAVGALHLAGEHGIVHLLRNQGYILSPIRSRKDIR
jgi:uncharacterized protein YbaP (TraB family)